MKCVNCGIEHRAAIGTNRGKGDCVKDTKVIEYEHSVCQLVDGVFLPGHTTRTTLCPSPCSELLAGTVDGSIHGLRLIQLANMVLANRKRTHYIRRLKEK